MNRQRTRLLGPILLLLLLWILPASSSAGIEYRTDSAILSDMTGEIEAILLQCSEPIAKEMFAVYKDLLVKIDPDTIVYVVCEEEGQVRRLRTLFRRWGVQNMERVRFMNADLTLSAWARDRFLVKASRDGRCVRELLVPKISLNEGTDWINDREVPWMIAGRSGESIVVTPSMFFLEGGDLVSSENFVFTSYATLLKQSVDLDPGVLDRMKEELGKEIVVIGGPDVPEPLWHIDMYLTPISDRTVLLAEPVQLGDVRIAGKGRMIGNGGERTGATPYGSGMVCEFRSSPQSKIAEAYDHARIQLEARGFHVERIPIVHDEDHCVMSYNNVLMEERDHRRIVYMPVYGLDELDRMAEKKYLSLGFEVRRINASGIYQFDGSLRCITNVLSRTDSHSMTSPDNPNDESIRPAPLPSSSVSSLN